MALMRNITTTKAITWDQSYPERNITSKGKDTVCIMKGEGRTSSYRRVSKQVGRDALTVFVTTASDFFAGKQEIAKVS